jgi:hypothetical protein
VKGTLISWNIKQLVSGTRKGVSIVQERLKSKEHVVTWDRNINMKYPGAGTGRISRNRTQTRTCGIWEQGHVLSGM